MGCLVFELTRRFPPARLARSSEKLITTSHNVKANTSSILRTATKEIMLLLCCKCSANVRVVSIAKVNLCIDVNFCVVARGRDSRHFFIACDLRALDRFWSSAPRSHHAPSGYSSRDASRNKAHPLPAVHFQDPRSRAATIQLSTLSFSSTCSPCAVLTVHGAVSFVGVRPACNQSIATPEPSSRTIPTLGRAIIHSPRRWMCRHTWETTVLSRLVVLLERSPATR